MTTESTDKGQTYTEADSQGHCALGDGSALFVMPEHDCFWCGQKTRSMFWACERCGPLKEEGYARARQRGENDYGQVIGRVYDVLRENGALPNDKAQPRPESGH